MRKQPPLQLDAIPPGQPGLTSRAGWIVACCGLTTLLAWPLRGFLEPPNIAMLYLLAVAIVAIRADKLAAIIAAILSTAMLDFFFIHPVLSFSITHMQYAITLAVMLTVALIVADLAARLRLQALAATQHEQLSQALYLLASQLAGSTSLQQVAVVTREYLHDNHHCTGMLLIRNNELLQLVEAGHQELSSLQIAAAETALHMSETRHMREADHHWLFLPLRGATYIRGILAIDFGQTPPAHIETQKSLYEAIAALIATSIERLHFFEIAQHTQLQIMDERLRNTLLSAISHDIRTPLTILYGMADTLTRSKLQDSDRTVAEAIREQARRLNSIVSNLLDMAKLRAGNIQLDLQWQPVEEVIGSSIKLLGDALQQHPVNVSIAPDFPLLRFDAVLIERVLCNLFENSVKYAYPDSPIYIRADFLGSFARISVWDRGPGFPPYKLDAVFGLFERGDNESSIQGAGLGLAICRTIVAAHGGEISARNDNGACISFTLPLGNPPHIETESENE